MLCIVSACPLLWNGWLKIHDKRRRKKGVKTTFEMGWRGQGKKKKSSLQRVGHVSRRRENMITISFTVYVMLFRMVQCKKMNSWLCVRAVRLYSTEAGLFCPRSIFINWMCAPAAAILCREISCVHINRSRIQSQHCEVLPKLLLQRENIYFSHVFQQGGQWDLCCLLAF